MGRRVQINRPASQAVTRPIRFGGTDATTIEGAKQNLDLVDKSVIGINDGVSKMNATAIVPFTELPFWCQEFKDYVTGPKSVPLGEVAVFKIGNYNERNEYVISANDVESTVHLVKSEEGSVVSINGMNQWGYHDSQTVITWTFPNLSYGFPIVPGTIIFTPPSSAGIYGFTLNGRVIEFEVYENAIYPDIYFPFDGGTYRSNQTFKVTEFSQIDPTGYCDGTEVQFSKTNDFQVNDLSLIYSQMKNMFSISAGLVVGETYFVRIRYKEMTEGGLTYQPWTTPVQFTYLGAS